MRTCLQPKRDNMETKGDRETKFETSKNFTDLLVWKKADTTSYYHVTSPTSTKKNMNV